MALPIVAPHFQPYAGAIDITAGKQYYYVIAETGATSVTLDPASYGYPFTSAIFNSGGVYTLSFKFVGQPQVPPQIEYLTIHITNASGTITQQLAFRIFANASIPNITNLSHAVVALGDAVNFPILTDIATQRYCGALPSGLSFNSSTGRVTGRPPQVNATYFLTFGAVASPSLIQDPAYFRYFVLIIGTGSDGILLGQNIVTNPPPSGGGIIVGGDPTGKVLYDGDFTVPMQVGQPIGDAPFLPQDDKHYIYKVCYWQRRDAYAELGLDVPGPYGGFHVGTVKGSFKDITGGVIEFWREFAIVPDLRNEFESFNYSYQIVGFTIGTESSAQIGEVPITVHSRVQYDYWHTTDPEQSIPLARAPRAVMVPTGGSTSGVALLNGWGSSLPGQDILAEDATYEKWKGNIYARKQRFVEWEDFHL